MFAIFTIGPTEFTTYNQMITFQSTGSKIFADDFAKTCDHVLFQSKYDTLVAQCINIL